MMKKLIFNAALLGAVILALCGCSSVASVPSDWHNLMTGNGLADWEQTGSGNWRFENGMLVGEKGKAGFLVTRRVYSDFMIRAEIWVSDDANSGIFIRAEDSKNLTGKNAYEVNIFDQRPDPTYRTGAIVYVAKPLKFVNAGGHWNLLEISAIGDSFTVTLNGVRTVEGARDSSHHSGVIGLQSDGGLIKFRKVEIKEM